MIRKFTQMKQSTREHMRGGEKEVAVLDIMDKGTMEHCRMFSRLTLKSGASIGEHQHTGETEYYWILKGEGIVTESDGEHKVEAGDVVVTGGGASHAIRNDGREDLVFLALIILS